MIRSVAFCFLLLIAVSVGFCPVQNRGVRYYSPSFEKTASRKCAGSTSSTSTSISSTTLPEDSLTTTIKQAQSCINSDSCSVQEAEAYLQKILSITNGRTDGTFTGESLGDKPVFVGELVAGLTSKSKPKRHDDSSSKFPSTQFQLGFGFGFYAAVDVAIRVWNEF